MFTAVYYHLMIENRYAGIIPGFIPFLDYLVPSYFLDAEHSSDIGIIYTSHVDA